MYAIIIHTYTLYVLQFWLITYPKIRHKLSYKNTFIAGLGFHIQCQISWESFLLPTQNKSSLYHQMFCLCIFPYPKCQLKNLSGFFFVILLAYLTFPSSGARILEQKDKPTSHKRETVHRSTFMQISSLLHSYAATITVGEKLSHLNPLGSELKGWLYWRVGSIYLSQIYCFCERESFLLGIHLVAFVGFLVHESYKWIVLFLAFK